MMAEENNTLFDIDLAAGRSRFALAPITVVAPCDQPRSFAAGILGRKLSVPQAAKMLGVGQTKLRQFIRKGEIPVIRIMGKLLLLEEDVKSFLQGGYGPLKQIVSGFTGRLPPLPKCVLNSELFAGAR